MTTRRACVAVALVAALALQLVLTSAAGAKEPFRFGYVGRTDDSFYDRHRGYTGLVLRDQQPPIDGAKVAVRESRVIGRSLGIEFELVEITLATEEDPVAALSRISEQSGIGVFILDLPLEDVKATAKAFARSDLVLFNVRHPDDTLRGSDCSPVLFHTIPSHAMLMDGLAQYLFKKTWTDVLMLEGESSRDKVLGAAFRNSARKFRLEIADVRPFVVSNDPRRRDQTNIPILTGSADYDVIFVVDTSGELDRYVPYASYHPRPVIGTAGLGASAWHWTWERYGAPQLNQRFDRIAKRRMEGKDWAAWAAVKSIVEAIARTKSTEILDLRAFLSSKDFTLDTYKGAPGGFRHWDRQLRQPVLLHSHDAVLARAPIEGFLHEKNNLDTLGADQPESTCSL